MRRVAIFVLAIAVPTVALGIGWLLSAHREEAAAARQRRESVERGADAVVAAIAESLEDLRAREDARPYDVYNYYYTPEGVLATEEAVAVSPIAGRPDDRRVLGWFQVDPGGRVRSPSIHPDAPSEVCDVGEEFVRLLRPQVVDACSPLAHGSPLALAEEPEVRPLAGAPSNPVQNTGEWTTEIANAIREANSGSLEQKDNLARQGRGPRPARRVRSWEALEGVVTITVDGTPVDGTAAQAEPRTLSLGRHTVWLRGQEMPGGEDDGRGTVVYTPMAYGRLAGRLALYRVVTSEGASSVQGLLLDEEEIRTHWLPDVARRHAGAVARTKFAPASRRAREGAVVRPLPTPLEATALWLSPLSIAPARGLSWQIAALVGLCLLVVAGGATMLRAERRAANLASMQRDFVAAVSHELRTPLTTLRMHAELLREGWVDEASRARFHDDLVVESTRLGQLVENVLVLSRLERGKRPEPKAGDLAAAVQGACEKRRRFVELRGFALEVETVETPASFDLESVDTIVANLLDNAVKYGGAEERVVRVGVRATAERALMTVSDRGAGIAPAEHERVFDAFYRSEGVAGTGTGLGLALVRRLAREQGGDARIAQAEKGCTVEVWLPRG